MSVGKILVVDDDRRTLAGFRDFPGARGYEAITAEQAREGLELLERDGTDLVVLDVYMPGMNGLEAARVLQRKRSRTRIFMSGRSSPETAVTASILGARVFHPKPRDSASMPAAFERAVLSERAMDQTTRVTQARSSAGVWHANCKSPGETR